MIRKALWLVCLSMAAGACAPGSESAQGVATLVGRFHEPLPAAAPKGEAGDLSDVIVLTPVPCEAVSRSDRGAGNPCPEALLRAGSADGREFVAAVSFDLSRLAPAAEVRYAGLELTGLDAAFLEQSGEWQVRMIDLPPGGLVGDMSFGRLMGSSGATPGASWRLRAAELAPGGRNVLEFDQVGMDALAVRLGRGRAAFLIEGPSQAASLFGWAASGADAPRLRVGYVAMPDATPEDTLPTEPGEPDDLRGTP